MAKSKSQRDSEAKQKREELKTRFPQPPPCEKEVVDPFAEALRRRDPEQLGQLLDAHGTAPLLRGTKGMSLLFDSPGRSVDETVFEVLLQRISPEELETACHSVCLERPPGFLLTTLLGKRWWTDSMYMRLVDFLRPRLAMMGPAERQAAIVGAAHGLYVGTFQRLVQELGIDCLWPLVEKGGYTLLHWPPPDAETTYPRELIEEVVRLVKEEMSAEYLFRKDPHQGMWCMCFLLLAPHRKQLLPIAEAVLARDEVRTALMADSMDDVLADSLVTSLEGTAGPLFFGSGQKENEKIKDLLVWLAERVGTAMMTGTRAVHILNILLRRSDNTAETAQWLVDLVAPAKLFGTSELCQMINTGVNGRPDRVMIEVLASSLYGPIPEPGVEQEPPGDLSELIRTGFPLHKAATWVGYEAWMPVVERFPSLLAITNLDKRTPLHFAVGAGMYPAILAFAALCPPSVIRFRNAKGETAFEQAQAHSELKHNVEVLTALALPVPKNAAS